MKSKNTAAPPRFALKKVTYPNIGFPREARPELPAAVFSARLTRPIYVGDTVMLAGHAPKDGKVLAWVQDKDGNLCAQLDCEFA